jgi:phospholipase/carboxylesterase
MTTNEPVVRWRKAKHDGAGRPPLLVLLHGRGADENDLFELAPAIDPAFAVASVRAPIAMDEGGYTWSESTAPGRYIATSLRASIVRMQQWFDAIDGGRPDPQRTYLLGFSAGMAIASALILDEPARYAGGVFLSGTLPFETDLSITKNRLADVDIFYGRGTFDTAIPGDLVERTATYLHDRSGARLTERTYPIPHSISDAEIADISRWLVACETAALTHTG